MPPSEPDQAACRAALRPRLDVTLGSHGLQSRPANQACSPSLEPRPSPPACNSGLRPGGLLPGIQPWPSNPEPESFWPSASARKYDPQILESKPGLQHHPDLQPRRLHSRPPIGTLQGLGSEAYQVQRCLWERLCSSAEVLHPPYEAIVGFCLKYCLPTASTACQPGSPIIPVQALNPDSKPGVAGARLLARTFSPDSFGRGSKLGVSAWASRPGLKGGVEGGVEGRE